MAERKSTLDERIAQARVEVAKSAIGSPYVYPQWGRLQAAAAAVRAAHLQHAQALREWRDLIADAPPEWKKLAPPEPEVTYGVVSGAFRHGLPETVHNSPISLRARVAPLLNAFGELHWRSGRGHDVSHEQINEAFEAVLAAACVASARGRLLADALAQEIRRADGSLGAGELAEALLPIIECTYGVGGCKP